MTQFLSINNPDFFCIIPKLSRKNTERELQQNDKKYISGFKSAIISGKNVEEGLRIAIALNADKGPDIIIPMNAPLVATIIQ